MIHFQTSTELRMSGCQYGDVWHLKTFVYISVCCHRINNSDDRWLKSKGSLPIHHRSRIESYDVLNYYLNKIRVLKSCGCSRSHTHIGCTLHWSPQGASVASLTYCSAPAKQVSGSVPYYLILTTNTKLVPQTPTFKWYSCTYVFTWPTMPLFSFPSILEGSYYNQTIKLVSFTWSWPTSTHGSILFYIC